MREGVKTGKCPRIDGKKAALQLRTLQALSHRYDLSLAGENVTGSWRGKEQGSEREREPSFMEGACEQRPRRDDGRGVFSSEFVAGAPFALSLSLCPYNYNYNRSRFLARAPGRPTTDAVCPPRPPSLSAHLEGVDRSFRRGVSMRLLRRLCYG